MIFQISSTSMYVHNSIYLLRHVDNVQVLRGMQVGTLSLSFSEERREARTASSIVTISSSIFVFVQLNHDIVILLGPSDTSRRFQKSRQRILSQGRSLESVFDFVFEEVLISSFFVSLQHIMWLHLILHVSILISHNRTLLLPRCNFQGDIQGAIDSYTEALQSIPMNGVGASSSSKMMASTLFSNRAMCYLKIAETKGSSSNQSGDIQQSLRDCIEDCNSALDRLTLVAASDSSSSNNNNLRGKVLYRRARALVTTSQTNIYCTDDDKEKNLNEAAKDLLQLLSFDANNKEAAALLRSVRAMHGTLGGGMGRSRISRALDLLRGRIINDNKTMSYRDGDNDLNNLQCLRVLQGSLAEESSSYADEIGRRGGVPLLLQIARQGIASSKSDSRQQQQKSDIDQCRTASIHILSACCSLDSFILKYAGRESLPPSVLAQIVEEEASSSKNSNEGSADVAVAAMALLIRLIVHWDHREAIRYFAAKITENGIVEDNAMVRAIDVPEVDASSICRVAIAAFLWGSNNDNNNNGDARTPRAALDLLAAWTASDLEALDAASDACYTPSSSSPSSTSGHGVKKLSYNKLRPEDTRNMKPRQVAAHKKREHEYKQNNLKRALQHVHTFCSEETGGLDAMLTCAAKTDDHRLRREMGLQIGRLLNVIEESDDAKKLVAKALGCTNWRIGHEDDNESGATALSKLTIEELDEEKEDDSDENQDELLAIMKRGQLTASLLIGKSDVGAWALKYGWSDGNGVDELKKLIFSNDSRAMSIASELVSAASSVEKSRPLLATLVQEGTLEDLLIHPNADVRSGAASCAAKIGLASKALSEDDGEVMSLLDVAIELLFEEDEGGTERDGKSKQKPESSSESTSMDRGIEVMTYIVSKTFVKEKIVAGYKPKGSPPDRKSALERLVEIACAPNSGDAQMAFGLAGIFNLLAVSMETLRKEAFIGKEITKEQYDQLQALGKTEEEKEIEAKKDAKEEDTSAAVRERIRKLANANVPRAMVKLLEGSTSDSTQEKLFEGMGRMASEQSVRGIMIQQGCLTTCLQLDKGEKPNETEKKILRQARSCIAKLLVTTNPSILTVSQRSGSIGPLLKLVKDNDATDLMHFEALLSLTNLAGFSEETKNRVVAQKGIPTLSYAMFSEHEMVRQAATEALLNMIPHPEMMQYLKKEDNIRVWVAFALDYEANFACARAAVGCLAMAAPDPDFADALVACPKFGELIRTLLECGQLELMHRVFALVTSLIEHGGKCREAVISTGAGPFCKAYLESYHDEKNVKDFNFTPAERGSLAATLSLAKEILQLLS
jgi:hypothetical protein